MTTQSGQAGLHAVLQQFVDAADTDAAAGPAVEAARAAISALLARTDELERAVAELRITSGSAQQVARQLADAEQLVGHERELQAEIAALQHRNDELTQLIELVHGSMSWKVTEPIRKVGAMARTTAVDAVRKLRKA